MLREGERLEAWNRRLLDDPGAALPESLDQRCLQIIRRRPPSPLRKAGTLLRTAAALAVIAAALFTTAFAVSDEFREAALELVHTVTGSYTQLDIRRTGQQDRQKTAPYFKWVEVGWTPEGFAYSGGEYDQYADFANGQGQSFRVELWQRNHYVPIDLEYPYASETVTVNGERALCLTKDAERFLSVLDPASGCSFALRTSGGVSLDTAKKILENVRRSPNAGYFENVQVGWLPDGFAYAEGSYDWYAVFQSGSGARIQISVYDGDGSLKIGTEGADQVDEISVNGNEGLCVLQGETVHIVFTDLAHNLYVDLLASGGLSRSTVNKVAEHIAVIPEEP